MAEESGVEFILPLQVASRIDVGRLLREVHALNDFLHQASIREPGETVKLPKSSRLFDELVKKNNFNMLHQEDREKLVYYLEELRSKAPIMHISFSSDPSPRFMKDLVRYLRKELHPYLLVRIGLQPTLGAGCIVRTTNKIFDFSLRQNLLKQNALLLEKIKGLEQAEQPAEAST